MSLSLPPLSDTFGRHDVNGKYLMRALGEYLELAYELRAGIDPLRDPHFFLQENDKIETVEAFVSFVRRDASMLDAFEPDFDDDEEGEGNGDEDE
ncbi:hypothetical protein LJY25_08195 [Hymenobacter sp. BT175]|uniref:hypothetical protein n=1 Tax=Hymenobacter translucens TaxID=2886507 RepID=UPI001D0F09E8|nr:hypothetical protein [Hymenobacter translucens]MCC2546422.1 hypothetical protein [Hymenobacter translucens]